MTTQLIHKSALALCFGLAITAPGAHAQFGKISEAEEIQAGRQSAAQAVKEYGRALPQSDPRARRVARLGAMFAAQSQRKNIPYSYTVLQNDKVLNAFAAPGGPIFVTTKLISTAANDAELAYVLGHETGHIERKHIVNQVAKQQTVGLGVGILGAILGRGRNNQAVSVASSLALTAFTSKYSRKDEDDADKYGVRVMARLGFDPRAAVSMLGKLGGGSGTASFLASHPSPKSRQSKVSELIRKENLQQIAQQAGGARLTLTGSDGENLYGAGGYGVGANGSGSDDSGDSYPNAYPDAYPTNGNADGEEIRLSAPLRLVNSGNSRVVLVSVAELARYAGGSARAESAESVTVSRGGDYLRMAPGSTRAVLNGRQVQISVAPRVVEGRFYAPLGSVVAGLGGTARLDENRNAVRLDFDGRGGYLALP